MARGRSRRHNSLHLQSYMYEGGGDSGASRNSSPHLHCCSKAPGPCTSCWRGSGSTNSSISPEEVDQPWCGGTPSKLTVFIVTGVLQIVVAFLTGVIYFSIRTLTTSLEHVETIPTYANGILLLCTGILVLFLYKRRDAILLVATMVLNLVCCVVCGTSVILTSLRAVHTLSRFEVCQYDSALYACYCYITRVTEAELRSMRTKSGELEYIYKGAPSCGAIQSNLRDYMLALCTLYGLGVLLCILTVAAIVLVKHSNRGQQGHNPPSEILALPTHMEAPAYEENESFSLRRSSQQRRRRTTADLALFPRMALPGMEEGLAQSLGLPGDGQARLLRIRRHNSLDSIPLQSPAGNQLRENRVIPRRTSDASDSRSHREQRASQGSDTRNEVIQSSILREAQVQRSNSQASQLGRLLQLYPHALSSVHRQEREVQRSLSDSSRQRPHQILHRPSITDYCGTSASGFSQTIPLYSAARPLSHPGVRTSYGGREVNRPRRRPLRGQRMPSTSHSYNGARHYWHPRDRFSLPSHMAYLHLMDSFNQSQTGVGGASRSEGGSHPYPPEPPPPYTQCQLPPYIENDPAPSYRSRSSPVPSLDL